jgi:16S rRNA (guanine527-N7)-methyltransferase
MRGRSERDEDVASRIAQGAERVGATVSADALGALAAYIGLLTKWNRRLNLTALALEPLSEEAVDRLVVEAIVAAAYVRPSDRIAIDIGSGGGSPAIPLKVIVPALQLVLVESKARKAAFLREAVRELGLSGVEVETGRFEDLAAGRHRDSVDLISIRAVRTDASLWKGIWSVLSPGGRVFWFGGSVPEPAAGVHAVASEAHDLIPHRASRLTILSKLK